MIHKRAIVLLTSILLLCGSSAHSEGPAKLRSFKGWELYSWKDAQDWRFSLLIGTNRLKSCEEVKNDKATKSLAQLEETLDKLAPAEWITWSFSPGPNLSGPCELAKPPQTIIEQIESRCKRLDLHLKM